MEKNFSALCAKEELHFFWRVGIPRSFGNFQVFAKIMFLYFSYILGPKNYSKNLSTRRPNPSKIDAENVLFFNIDFFGIGPQLRSILDLQLGAKSAILASKD